MSPDALTNLVHRTLTLDRAVGPYVPSRYEGDGGSATDLERDVEVTTRPDIAPPATGRSIEAPPTTSPPTVQYAEPPIIREETSTTEVIVPASDPTTVPAAEQRPLPKAQHAGDQPPTPGTGADSEGPSLGRTDSVVEPAPEPGTIYRGAPLAAGRVEPPRPDNPKRPPVPRAVAVAPLSAEIVSADEPTAEPVVNITIGRVEVRTRGPIEAKPPVPTTSPRRVMSLDEYLDRRGRGPL